MNPADVPMPDRLQARPRERRGYPIPFATLMLDDGTPDLRTLDTARVAQCVAEKLCGLCGQRLKSEKWFVGGPLCVRNRAVLDPAMHEDCARYAIRVCPYLCMPKAHHSKAALPEFSGLAWKEAGASDARPETMHLMMATEYRIEALQMSRVIRVPRWLRVEAWRPGHSLPLPDAMTPAAGMPSTI